MSRIDHALHKESNNDGPYWLALTSFNITQNITRNSAVQLRKAYKCAQSSEYDIASSVFTSGTIGRDSVINTELVCAFSCEFTSVPPGEFEMLKNIRKFRSLNHGLVKEPSFIDRNNSIARYEGLSPFFFFREKSPRAYLLLSVAMIFFGASRWRF